jgi:hypothetical protein
MLLESVVEGPKLRLDIPEVEETGSAAGHLPSLFVVRRHIFSLLSDTALYNSTQPI